MSTSTFRGLALLFVIPILCLLLLLLSISSVGMAIVVVTILLLRPCPGVCPGLKLTLFQDPPRVEPATDPTTPGLSNCDPGLEDRISLQTQDHSYGCFYEFGVLLVGVLTIRQ